MKPEDLIKKYPKMFPKNEKREFVYLLPFGFENVWIEYVDKLMRCIQNYIDQNEHLKIPQVHVHQIKQKFGMMRFYTDGGDKIVHGMIWFAEYYSQYICEKCCLPGTLKENKMSWYMTLCDKHWKENNKE